MKLRGGAGYVSKIDFEEGRGPIMKIIETERLILRTWLDCDLEPMSKINQDPRVMEYFPGLYDFQHTKKFIEREKEAFAKLGYTLYAVELKESGEFIGFVGLSLAEFDAHFTPATEIGWRLASAHWGKGYATEAAKAVLHYAFTELKLDEVVSFTTVNNTKSRRVMEKIGLKHNESDDFDHRHPSADSNSPPEICVLYRLTRDKYFQR